MTKLNTISISYNRILSVLRYCVCINHHFLKFVVVIALMSFSFVFGQEDNNRSPAKYRPRTRTIVPLIPQPAVKIEFRRMRFGRPKLVYLLFDVRLRNDQKSPRWLLLPSNLGSGHSAIGEKGGVDTLEVFSPRGKGHVVVGRFLGTGGFNALLLPPGAAVRLRLFPISYWGDPPDNLEIEIVIAKELTIDGDKIEKWFGNSPLSSVKADIAEDAENPMWMRTAKRTKDNKEVVPVIEEDQRLRLQVALGNKKSP
ncbi:MAG TPA: hypothetical protein VIX17_28375 [Pyrinomonadaceae bacterium]|jgi:hypothetical protein